MRWTSLTGLAQSVPFNPCKASSYAFANCHLIEAEAKKSKLKASWYIDSWLKEGGYTTPHGLILNGNAPERQATAGFLFVYSAIGCHQSLYSLNVRREPSMKMSKEIIDRYSKEGQGLLFGDGRYRANHRFLVIQKTCDLESEICALFAALITKYNPNITGDRLQSLMFGDGRPLGSLKRAADAAFAFGLISEDVQHDLKKIGDMRDRYAHDQNRKQLEKDEEMLSKLHQCRLWLENKSALSSLDADQVFRCIGGQLSESLKEASARIAAEKPRTNTAE